MKPDDKLTMPCPFSSMTQSAFIVVVMLIYSAIASAYSINSNSRLTPSIIKEVAKKLTPKMPEFAQSNMDPKPMDSTSNESEKISLPWKTSINPKRDMTYMSMFEAQLNRIHKLGMKEVELENNIKLQKSGVKPARIGNLCFQNDRFRKVRMTYFDAGDAVQVFNSLWYPSYEYDLPLLGIDLISLGKNRVLTVVDFQPLHPTDEYHNKYIEHLTPIRNKYKDLQGTLSGKIYDDTSFFSKNMLFGRFTDEGKVSKCVGPAFEEYLDTYLSLMEKAEANTDVEAMAIVKERQQKYDEYSARKDPAVGLFDAYFGKEWSSQFVGDFLFSLCPKESLHGAQPHNFKVNSNTGEVSVKSTSNSPHGS